MFSKLFEKKNELLVAWINSIDLDLDEAEIKFQFSKLLDIIFAHLKGEEINEHLKEFVEDMIKYEVDAKKITEYLEHFLKLTESMDLGEKELLVLNKEVYQLALRIYEEFEKERLEVINSQIETIKKMEIPILKLNKDTVLIPLVGFIDSEKALNLMRKILETIRREETLNVILDIEGIPVIDTEVAHQFVRIYRGVKAIGAKMIMSGITPAVAEVMVHLEIDLPIPTKANLELAIEAFRNEEI